jgi:hypothetical protein
MGYIEPPTPGFYIINNTLYLLLFPPVSPQGGGDEAEEPLGRDHKIKVSRNFP